MPHRGKRNESAYLPIIAQKIADIQQISVEKVIEQTTKNALSFVKESLLK
jgi:TatD DNase family protein